MNEAAKRENEMTLREILGMTESEARELIDANIIINSAADEEARITARYVSELLVRTVRSSSESIGANPTLEVLVNTTERKTSAKPVYVHLGNSTFHVALVAVDAEAEIKEKTHESLLLIAACYISGFALRQLIKSDTLPSPSEIRLDFRTVFGQDLGFLEKEAAIEKTFLAGAGAIGNGFIAGLVTFKKLTGSLVIADADKVSSGNLNRCILFTEEDIGKNKAERLAAMVERQLPQLKVTFHDAFLSNVPERKNDERWLERLIVGVDSRRARRNLQNEIPREVFDASTTGITEFVLHHHVQPTEHACMSCIYDREEVENAHEKHVADKLGVSVGEIISGYVDAEAERKIKQKYPSTQNLSLIGLAYDTLFKQLCGEGKLTLDGDTQVLAPLAFVSTMAGTYLAVEFVRQLAGSTKLGYNYWRISPWIEPNIRLQQLRPKNPKCEFCSSDVSVQVAKELWN